MRPELRSALRRIDRQFDAVRAMPTPIPAGERHRRGIEDVTAGGYIRVSGEVYRVVAVSDYREKKSGWKELELFGLLGGQTRFIEWERDDEVEVSWNDPPLSLRELGLSADEIEAMSDAERGTIRHGGRSYEYDDDYRATYYRGGWQAGQSKADGETVYFYDFETSDERFCLTVEEWGSESEGYDYEVFVSEYIDPDSVEVLVTGDSDAS